MRKLLALFFYWLGDTLWNERLARAQGPLPLDDTQPAMAVDDLDTQPLPRGFWN